jgi:hypothetical protein
MATTPWGDIYGVQLIPRLPLTVPPVQPGYETSAQAARTEAVAVGPTGEGVFDKGQTPVRIYWRGNEGG